MYTPPRTFLFATEWGGQRKNNAKVQSPTQNHNT